MLNLHDAGIWDLSMTKMQRIFNHSKVNLLQKTTQVIQQENEAELNVLIMIEENKNIPLRQVGQTLDISHSTVHTK